jgi:hypothetical protein
MRMNRAARYVRAGWRLGHGKADGGARGLWHHLRSVSHHRMDMSMTTPAAEFAPHRVIAHAR